MGEPLKHDDSDQDEQIRALEQEKETLARQLELARREIAELKAAEAVDIDLEEPDAADEVSIEEPEADSGFESGGFDGKTDELTLPPAGMLPDPAGTTLEAMFEQTEEPAPAASEPEDDPDPFDGLHHTGNTNPRFQPLEAMPVATPKPIPAETEKKPINKRALIFVGVAATALVAAGIFGLMAYRARTLDITDVVATTGETAAQEVAAQPMAEPTVEPAVEATEPEPEPEPEPELEPATTDEPAPEPEEPAAVATEPDEPPAAKKPAPRRKPKAKPKAKRKPAKKGKSIDALFDKFGKK